MKHVEEVLPWKMTDISLRPYSGMWSLNPSIHFDGTLWRCSIRCSDYCMPGGVTIRGEKARPGENRSKNVMVIFDPQTWRAIEIYKMREQDELPRTPCLSHGYEDIRIFSTDRSGLQGIAASLHLRRSDRTDARAQGGILKQPAEQVLLSFDDEYNISEAQPLRGVWSAFAQKNWVPFDRCVAPRFLYSIDQGTLFDERGSMRGDAAIVRHSRRSRGSLHEPRVTVLERARRRAEETEVKRAEEARQRSKRAYKNGGQDRHAPAQISPQEVMYHGLRGGSQLVRVEEDGWLGIGHLMKFVDGLKYYYHVWYLVDSRGKMKAASPPMKLASNGIEFAAGIAIDGDRVVVSFGVDDMECRLGETKMSAVLEILRPVNL